VGRVAVGIEQPAAIRDIIGNTHRTGVPSPAVSFRPDETAADSIGNTNEGIFAFHNQADLIGRLVAVVAQLGCKVRRVLRHLRAARLFRCGRCVVSETGIA
jgi:hypothetical protein